MLTQPILSLLEHKPEASPLDIFDKPQSELLKGSMGERLLNFSQLTQTDNQASFLTYKIILGDGGDGVPELIYKPAGKKTMHCQPKWIAEAIESIGMTHDSLIVSMIYDESYIKHMIEFCYKKLYKSDIEQNELDWLMLRWAENRKLVTLNDKEIPQQVQSDMFDNIKAVNLIDMLSISKACKFTVDELLSNFQVVTSDNVMSMHENIIYNKAIPESTTEIFDVDDIVAKSISK